jgi:hypothetical protein
MNLEFARLMTDPIIEAILTAPSRRELFRTWQHHHQHLRGYRLMLSTPGPPNLPVPGRLDFQEGGFLRGLFTHDHMLYVDNKLVRQSVLPWGAWIALDSSVTFDTQVVRYLALAVQGSTNPVVPRVKAALVNLVQAGWNWDFFAYVEENADRMNRSEVYANRNFHDNLRAAEIVKDLDERHFLATGELRPRSSERQIAERVEAVLVFAENRPEPLRHYYRQSQRVMYAVLMAITWIQLRAPRRSVREKLLDLLNFFHDDMHALMARELAYAAVFFTRGQRMTFFGRVQRSRADLPAVLNNMAWDLLIARRLEHHVGVGSRDGRFYLPSLLTFDQDLVALMDGYSLRGALLLPDGSAVSLPSSDVESLLQSHGLSSKDLRPFLSAEARGDRRDRHAQDPPDLEALIKRLERQVTELN